MMKKRMMKYIDSLRIVWYCKYGNIENLERLIGKKNLDLLLSRGMIVCGIIHSDIWRITEKGKELGNALFLRSKFRRFIDKILYHFI